MAAFSSDFVGFPIIISDYDALVLQSPIKTTLVSFPSSSRGTGGSGSTEQTSSSPSLSTPSTSQNNDTSSSSRPSSSSASSSTGPAEVQNWTTGFADFADAVWNRMDSGLRRKLREACVEVLRRTEDPGEEERVFGGLSFRGENGREWDEDARFLD